MVVAAAVVTAYMAWFSSNKMSWLGTILLL
jgi:hypothetical protein